jgi:phosphoglycerate dehydrogenase-like enzyme
LKAVFYAAGSVQRFARPLLDRDIVLTSAARTNGRMVAQFTVGQMLLGAKGFFQNARDYSNSRGDRAEAFLGEGVYQTPVAVLGAGAVGRQVLEMMRPFAFDVAVFDPFCTEEQIRSLEGKKVTLAEAFEQSLVVSNHLADKPETRRLITGDLIERLPAKATLINTGRGATINESQMIDVLGRRPDLTALLDVTDPEPPSSDSPLFSMPNVWLTSHIAGAKAREWGALADSAINQFERWCDGQSLIDQVTPKMLERMA